MKLKINNKKEEPLLSRNKVDGEVEFDAAVPSRKEVLKSIADQTGSEPELVVVTKIDPGFGSRKAKVSAYVYKDKKALDQVEEKKKFARTGFKEEKKEEAAATAEAPKAE